MGLSPQDYSDLFSSAIADHGKGVVEDIAMPLQEYVAYGIMTGKGQMEKYNSEGPYIRRHVRLNGQGNATWTDLYDSDSLANTNMMAEINTQYKYAKTGYMYDLRERDINLDTPAAVVYDLIKVKRQAAFCDQASIFEEAFWDCPDAITSKKLLGLAYWLAYNATVGFTGSNPSGSFSNVGGLDPSLSANAAWRNWSGNYDQPNATDLVRKMRQAYMKTAFKNPEQMVGSVTSPTRKLGIYTTYPVISKLEELMELRDDNIGTDLAMKDGTLRFRGVSVSWVPQIDTRWGEGSESLTVSAGAHPVFGVDWSTFKLLTRPSWWMKESNRLAPENHNIMNFWVDSQLQLFCQNRRRNWLLARSALLT